MAVFIFSMLFLGIIVTGIYSIFFCLTDEEIKKEEIEDAEIKSRNENKMNNKSTIEYPSVDNPHVDFGTRYAGPLSYIEDIELSNKNLCMANAEADSLIQEFKHRDVFKKDIYSVTLLCENLVRDESRLLVYKTKDPDLYLVVQSMTVNHPVPFMGQWRNPVQEYVACIDTKLVDKNEYLRKYCKDPEERYIKI